MAPKYLRLVPSRSQVLSGVVTWSPDLQCSLHRASLGIGHFFGDPRMAHVICGQSRTPHTPHRMFLWTCQADLTQGVRLASITACAISTLAGGGVLPGSR